MGYKAGSEAITKESDTKAFYEAAKTNNFKFIHKSPTFNTENEAFNKDHVTGDKCVPAILTCKGKQSEISLLAKPKPIGRLLPPNIIELKCNDTMKSLKNPSDKQSERLIKGDPGSVYTFLCPAGCLQGGVLYGSGLYGFRSSICKAAIQMGYLSNTEPNYVSAVIGYPQLKLTGAMNTEKVSSDKWPEDGEEAQPLETFAIIPTNTCYIKDTNLVSFSSSSFIQQKKFVKKIYTYSFMQTQHGKFKKY